MYLGLYEHTMDNKGRLSFPSKLREKLNSTFYITPGLDGCLFVFNEEKFEDITRDLKSRSIGSVQIRRFTRKFFSGAIDNSFDKQGRVKLTSSQIEHAGLNKDIVIIGVGDRIEVWDKERWQELSETEEMSLDNNADVLEELGL